MKAWAKSFYLSAAWEKTRAAYLMSQDYICERCGQPAKIVHHKRWLNRENINTTNRRDISGIGSTRPAAYSPQIRKIIKGGEYRGGYPKITLRACARVV